jgi:replicative DNA helicase
MLNFTLAFAKAGKKILYVSLEQDAEELTNLLMSIESEIPNDRTNTGRLADSEWPIFTQAFETLGSFKDRVVFETRAGTMATIQARIDRVYPDVVIVDSLGLVRGHEDEGSESMRIDAIGRDTKQMQTRTGIPILMVTHMNRAIEQVEREPRLSDFNQAGEKWCDVAMFIRKPPDTMSPAGFSTRRITVCKHRGGGLGSVDLALRECCTKFYNATSRSLDLGNRSEGSDYTNL